MKVKDVMTPRVIRVGPEEPAAVAARMLARYNVGALPVCDENGKICGMITDRDIVLRCVAADRNPEKVPVKHIMTGRVVTGRRRHESGRSRCENGAGTGPAASGGRAGPTSAAW